MADHVQKFLSQLPLFQRFSHVELETLIQKSVLKSYAPQEIIIQFGQAGKFLGVMISGEAEAVVTTKSGERHKLGQIGQGDMLGEISLLTGEPTNADVIALKPCQILLIPHDIFSTFLAANPHALQILAKTLTTRMRNRQVDEEEQLRVERARQNNPDPYGLRLLSVDSKKILVINCGSSSLKFDYFDTANDKNNLSGIVEGIGLKNARLVSSSKKVKTIRELGPADHALAFKTMVSLLTDPTAGVMGDLKELSGVGHRVVHGGDKYTRPVVVTDEVIQEAGQFADIAPLHIPPNLMAIKESQKLMPGVPQIAVFDTGFHQRIPRHASMYGLTHDLYENQGIRRVGFHGISHHYVGLKAATFLKRSFQDLKMLTCHLGSGSSICAIDHGKSIDTSTGMTPLEGLIMGTRCGDLDPGIILYLLREKGMSIQDVDELLMRKSGLKGLSGISSDLREIEKAANDGDPNALMAIQVFSYRIRKYIGAYVAALGGLDALVFTAGIGENSAWVRGLACQGLSYLGVRIDSLLNKTVSVEQKDVIDISEEDSQVKTLVIAADEGRMIAREVMRTLDRQSITQVIKSHKEIKIPIEVSAHHAHLSENDIEILFGKGKGLTVRSELSQPGYFACEETVNLIGPKGRVERVRVLGPARPETQVEISMTEEYKLGIKAPIRPSGDLKGSPGIILEGSVGTLQLSQGVICSLRHIHMSPEYALAFGLKDRDIVSIKVEGGRALIFGDVLVRVHPDFTLTMHIDTDEANAANIHTGMEGTLVGIQDRR